MEDGLSRQVLIERNALWVEGVPLGLAPPEPRDLLPPVDLPPRPDQGVAAVQLEAKPGDEDLVALTPNPSP